MDPLSQAAVGAVFAQTRSSSQFAKAAVIGALAAMAPDLDVLITSNTDPLLSLEYHRHFTHALAFIPIGGGLCAAVFYALFGRFWRLSFKQILLWSLLGYGSHGLLDAATTYGTQLLWPFSDARIAWNIIPVIEPLFTIPIVVLIFAAIRAKKRRYVWAAVLWGIGYLTLGFIQHERAQAMGLELAKTRGHSVERIFTMPTFANLIVWKTIYQNNNTFYTDAFKPGLFNAHIWQGESAQKVVVRRDFPWLSPTSQQAKDLARFRWFTSDWMAIDSHNPNRAVDIRYSMQPHKIQPIWGIELDQNALSEEHIDYKHTREGSGNAAKQLWQMISK